MNNTLIKSCMIVVFSLFLVSSTHCVAAVFTVTTKKQLNTMIESNTKPVIVRFFANWCSACKEMESIFSNIAEKYQNQYVFASVDISKKSDLANAYNVKGVPTFLFFKNGKQVDCLVGSTPQNIFEKKIEEIFNNS